MPRLHSTQSKYQKARSQKAFGLIEMSIVLAVIGLTIGAIWIAADALNERNRINAFAADISVGCARASQIFPSWSATAGTGQDTLTDIAYKANLLPSSWPTGTGAHVWNTLLGTTTVMKAPLAEIAVSRHQASRATYPSSVRFDLFPISKSACYKIIKGLAGPLAKDSANQTAPVIGMANTGYTTYNSSTGTVSGANTYWTYMNGSMGNVTSIDNLNCLDYNHVRIFCAP